MGLGLFAIIVQKWYIKSFFVNYVYHYMLYHCIYDHTNSISVDITSTLHPTSEAVQQFFRPGVEDAILEVNRILIHGFVVALV